MAERRFYYFDTTEQGPTESDPASDTITLAGMALTGNLGLSGGARITGVPDTPTAATDAVNQNYVDSVASGIKWKDPAAVLHLVGNATVATVNGLSPVAGEAYVMTDSGTLTAGSLSVAAGDLVEYSGSVCVQIAANSGG